METKSTTFIMIPEGEWNQLKDTLSSILEKLTVGARQPNAGRTTISQYLTAKEFMQEVKIKRTKFDQLVQGNKVRVIKKCRKIYVPISEIERYFAEKEIK